MKKFIICLSCILFLAFLWMSVQALKLEFQPELNSEPSKDTYSEEPEEFVIFTMPKTETHSTASSQQPNNETTNQQDSEDDFIDRSDERGSI